MKRVCPGGLGVGANARVLLASFLLVGSAQRRRTYVAHTD